MFANPTSASLLETWFTDDTASQGTDVETAGTRMPVSSTTFKRMKIGMHMMINLDDGDTVRVRGKTSTGTVIIHSGTFKMQKVG